EVEWQVIELVRKMLVAGDVYRDAVVVDWVLHEPVPAGVAVAKIGLAHEASIRDVHQIAGDGDADLHALHFVAPLILVRPPYPCAFVFARSRDPGMSCAVGAARHAAEPALLLRQAGIVKIDGVFASRAQRGWKVDVDRVEI